MAPQDLTPLFYDKTKSIASGEDVMMAKGKN
jgi:hypothetical protein